MCPPKIYLVVGLEEIAGGEDYFTFVIALEAGARSRVKDAIGTIAVVGGVATALGFEVIDVSRIDLRADVAGDIGIRNRHAIDEPRSLVAATHVELIVREVAAWNVVGYQGEAIGTVGARSFGDFLAADEGGRRRGLWNDWISLFVNGDGLRSGSEG